MQGCLAKCSGLESGRTRLTLGLTVMPLPGASGTFLFAVGLSLPYTMRGRIFNWVQQILWGVGREEKEGGLASGAAAPTLGSSRAGLL